MRVLLVSHAFPPDMGAASSRTWSMAKSLIDSGHEVDVITGRPYYPKGIVPKRYWRRFITRESQGGINILRVWVPALPTVGLWRRLVIYLCFEFSYTLALLLSIRQHHDLLLYVSPYALSFFSLSACIVGKLSGSRVILDVHDAWPEVVLDVGNIHSKSASRLLSIMTRIMVSTSDHITLAAQSMGSNLHTNKMSVLPLVVDTDFFKPSERCSSTIFVVGYSGIFGRRYDFASILSAAGILKDRKDIVFFIRGVGEMEDYIRQNLQPNVYLSTDILTYAQVVKWLNATDVLLCPLLPSAEAEKSSVPGKLIEYLSMGKPVICTDVGNIRELITESSSGIVIQPEDVKGLVDAILRLVSSPELRLTLGTNARSYAEKKFSLHALAEGITAGYILVTARSHQIGKSH